jgi:beta-galactosidase
VDGRDEGDTPGRNDKGLVSYDRKTRKDAFYYYKASWTTSPAFVHINGRRNQFRNTETVDIKVYSNSPGIVQLRVNGAAWPEPEIRDGVVRRWPVVPLPLGDNQIEAIAVGDANATVASDRLVWTRE